MGSMPASISLIVKVTNSCNLRCTYCYMEKTRCVENSQYMPIMDFPTLERMTAAALSSFRSVKFIWHGGEPLLAGLDFYREAIRFQQKYRRDLYQKIQNNLQTNGLLLDDAYLDFFLGHRFRLGVSLDGPKELHDRARVRPDGKGSHDAAVAAVARLAQHAEGRAGVVCVVAQHNIGQPEELYRYFYASPATSVHLLPYRGDPRHPELIVSPQQLADFWITLFELWVAEEEPLNLSTLRVMVRGMLGGRPQLCSFSGQCFKTYATIMSNGDVYPCSSFVADEFLLGNVHRDSFVQIMTGDRLQSLRERKNRFITRHCATCRYIDICAGGCREAAYEAYGDIEKSDWTCAARLETFAHIERRLLDILPGERERVKQATQAMGYSLYTPTAVVDCRAS